ncbi:THAP domain-containing protein 5-like [Topomyia yanbarensis]|uniref:THAP domain-containing protein 5-like n=1 Tax=Topomyia yanbarensis TaxID=2498891 RepID=UPI00273A9D6D|nr:THAP domain-containing protein 5-like [Topomyia yanbarensis]
MSKCHVPNCHNRSFKKTHHQTYLDPDQVSFHRFPYNEKRRKKWLDFLGIDSSTDTTNMFICSRHFRRDCFHDLVYLTTIKQRRRIRFDAIPTILEYDNNQNVSSKNKLMDETDNEFTYCEVLIEAADSEAFDGSESISYKSDEDLSDSNATNCTLEMTCESISLSKNNKKRISPVDWKGRPREVDPGLGQFLNKIDEMQAKLQEVRRQLM